MQKSILVALFAWAGLSVATATTAGTCNHETGVLYTFYGYADNTPPGADLAYTCADSVSGSTPVTGGVSGAPVTSSTPTTTKKGKKTSKWNGRRSYNNHRSMKRSVPQASGTGTYEDPLTMAGATKYFQKCEIIYSPYLQKYLRYEDTCTGCEDSASEGIVHIDIWTGPFNSNAGSSLLKCENSLTPSDKHTIVRSPPATLPVTTAELYSAGTCNTGLLQKVLDTATASFC